MKKIKLLLLLPLLFVNGCNNKTQNVKEKFVSWCEKQDWESDPYEILTYELKESERDNYYIANVYYYCFGEIKSKSFMLFYDSDIDVKEIKK